MVLASILYLTPLLYHLPQSVLAAIIIMAVVGLIDFSAIRHAWRADRNDGIAAIVTFLVTVGFAPQIDTGILVGVGLALVLFLVRTMKPRVAVLGRHPDGTLRDADLHGLPLTEEVAVVRFDGQLYFGNVSYFEDAILEVAARFPRAPHILVAGAGINRIDASGEQAIRHLTRASARKRDHPDLQQSQAPGDAGPPATGLLAEIGAESSRATMPRWPACAPAAPSRGRIDRPPPNGPTRTPPAIELAGPSSPRSPHALHQRERPRRKLAQPAARAMTTSGTASPPRLACQR